MNDEINVKLNTQAEVWEALLKGETILFPSGMIFFKIFDGKLASANEVEFENNDWDYDGDEEESFSDCHNGNHEIFRGIIPKGNTVKNVLRNLEDEICSGAFEQVEKLVEHLVERIEALESILESQRTDKLIEAITAV